MPGNGKYPRLHTTRNVISGRTALWDRMRKLHWMIKPKLHASWHYDKCCVVSKWPPLCRSASEIPKQCYLCCEAFGHQLLEIRRWRSFYKPLLCCLFESVMCQLLVLKQVWHNESQVHELVCICQSSPHQQTTCGYACCQGTNPRFYNTFIDEDNMSLLKRGMAAHGVSSSVGGLLYISSWCSLQKNQRCIKRSAPT